MGYGKGRVLLLLWVAWSWYVSAASAANLADTIAAIKPSIVAVGTTEMNRASLSRFMGTGFVVGDGTYVVTAEHVVSVALDFDHSESLAIFSGNGTKLLARTASKVSIDHEHDLVLLKMDGPPLPAVHFGDSNHVREGDALAFTGFPIGTVLGIYPVTHRATLSCITPIVIPVPRARQLTSKAIRQLPTPFTVFQLDATAYPGNSGSPLYDADTGRVVGLLNMVFVKSTKEDILSEPSGIAYAIPGDYIVQLIKDAGVSP